MVKPLRVALTAFCSSALVFSPTAPAEAAEPAEDDVYYEYTYQPIQQGFSVSKDSEETSESESRTSGDRFEYDDVTFDECAKHGNSGSKAHWVKNHFAFCRRGTVQIVGLDKKKRHAGRDTDVHRDAIGPRIPGAA